jgi:Fur family transcriptional regulator, zinc uptake regulator
MKHIEGIILANKYVACAHISCDHAQGVPQYLICGKCSLVKEISIKPWTIADLQITGQEAGFKLISPQLKKNCLCNDCLAQVSLQIRKNIQ